MKILTLNTHKGFSSFRHRSRFILHELRDAVRGVSADVVFLQEVIGEHEDYSTRFESWPPAPQYEFMAETIWGNVAYGRNAVYQNGHHGNAVLSKFPITRYRNIDVSVDKSGEPRGLLHCVLAVARHDVELHAICVHLGLLEAHRREQIERLCQLIADDIPKDAPVVVAGDFNDWRLVAHKRLSRCHDLQEPLALREGRPARTFPAFWPLLRLDRIYCRNLMVRAVGVLSHPPWSRLSDHAALVADVGF